VFVAVAGVAGGYYVWLDMKVARANARVGEDVRQELAEDDTTTPTTSGTPGLSSTTTNPPPDSPDAENILVLGSDTRSGDTEGSRSDTVMLVHVDPTNNFLSILSLPRDLRVEIDGFGTRKLNYAYYAGGVRLLIHTVKQVTGMHIDHFLQIDFQAFRDMTDALGGVYVEVDRRYYYNGYAYERIDLEPGYQLLSGYEALDYVRFRHDDNADFGRMGRQQRFLRAVRQQAMGWDLSRKLPGLIGAFLDNVTTDMGITDFLRLAWWGVQLDGSRIKQVTLWGINRMSGGVTFVFCTDAQIEEAVQSVLTPPGGEVEATTAVLPDLPEGATPQSIPDSRVWRSVATRVSFPVRAPAYVPSAYRIASRSGTYATIYDIPVGNETYPAMVMLYRHRGTGGPGEVKVQEEYLNLTATTWLEAPAACYGRQFTYNGTAFTIVENGGKVERVWWINDGVLYWVSNTLSRVASGSELLGMAVSTIPIPVQ
jgi:LCP family protein required for cell wall assembly